MCYALLAISDLIHRSATPVPRFHAYLANSIFCNRWLLEVSPNGPTPNLNVGCQRPLENDAVWVYRETRHGQRSIAALIDPYQDVYPNNTVVHYKCNSETAHSVANAVRCIDGEWIAQLSACGNNQCAGL
jgi:hypothetical protein